MAPHKWGVLVLHLSAQGVPKNKNYVDARDKVQADHKTKLEALGNSEMCEVETWPPQGASSQQEQERAEDNEGRAAGQLARGAGAVAGAGDDGNLQSHPRWKSFWQTFRSTEAQILIIFNDGVIQDDGYVFQRHKYRVRGVDLAADILFEFKRRESSKFQVILLAGLGTESIGKQIAEQFESLPLLVPPSIICWKAPSNVASFANTNQRWLSDIEKGLLDFTVGFLSETLSDRSPDMQNNKLDLRGTIHTFVKLRRDESGGKELASLVQFLPRNQIDLIEHIYYRLGLAAYELCRRIMQLFKSMALRFNNTGDRSTLYLEHSTYYLFAELFGWLHVLRQQPAQLYFQEEIRKLEFSFSGGQLQGNKTRLADHFQLLKNEIRMMGETVVETKGTLSFQVLPYIDFIDKFNDAESDFSSQFEKLIRAVKELQDENIYTSDNEKIMKPDNPKAVRLMWIFAALYCVTDAYTPEFLRMSTAKVRPLENTRDSFNPALHDLYKVARKATREAETKLSPHQQQASSNDRDEGTVNEKSRNEDKSSKSDTLSGYGRIVRAAALASGVALLLVMRRSQLDGVVSLLKETSP
ncbi:Uncharacterized protein SCF082_LOCUS21118 [Durusdinium trenchii]|uniref:Uncharacterized protein n=1 Tax=Durusdinium trenchii TaxID=1381693 RepID=A0ABP0L797_9DINO